METRSAAGSTQQKRRTEHVSVAGDAVLNGSTLMMSRLASDAERRKLAAMAKSQHALPVCQRACNAHTKP